MAFLSPLLYSAAAWFRNAIEAAGASSSRFEDQIILCCPATIVLIRSLTVRAIQEWLQQHGFRKTGDNLVSNLPAPDRRLYGCLVAHVGHGIIFLDQDDPLPEQHFTLAHEFAHFLADYHLPRLGALEKFGGQISDVLDGKRSPTPEERLEAVLRAVPIRLYYDFMFRDPQGQIVDRQTRHAETQADLLALELIAPHQDVLKRVDTRLPLRELVAALERLLAEGFTLPRLIAAQYAQQLAGYFGQPPTPRDWLGM